MLRIAVFLVLAIICALGILFIRIATVAHDPDVWHVDPLVAEASADPNHFRVAIEALAEQPVDLSAAIYASNPTFLAKAFDTFVMQQPSVSRVAGSPEQGWITYVQRTKWLRMPDYISVKFLDLPNGNSTIAIFSRSRFGQGDLGVNEARVRLWLESLEPYRLGRE